MQKSAKVIKSRKSTKLSTEGPPSEPEPTEGLPTVEGDDDVFEESPKKKGEAILEEDKEDSSGGSGGDVKSSDDEGNFQ